MTILDRIQAIKQQIVSAAETAHRLASEVHVVAVSKTRTVREIKEAIAAGQQAFGENYWQEAAPKIGALSDLGIEWHFIGPIQSNKAKFIAQHFSWVHSLCHADIAKRLHEARSPTAPRLNVFIQVKVDDEASKSGVAPQELSALAHAVAGYDRLALRGLMALPKPRQSPDEQQAVFRQLRFYQQQLIDQGFSIDCLSMGMSDDFPAAIAEGATHVRIGTALFGPRSERTDVR